MGEVTEKIYCCDRGDNGQRDLGLQAKSKSLWKV